MKNKVQLTAIDLNGMTVDQNKKLFEICLDHEPSKEEILSITQIAQEWQSTKVLKSMPNTADAEKMYGGKFWSVTFYVHKDDWLFWCGFCAGKKWGVVSNLKVEAKKHMMEDMGQWLVQI